MMMCPNSNGICQHGHKPDHLFTFSLARSTLTDSAFVKTLSDSDIIVWGGDVRDQEAWSGKHCRTI